MNSASQQRLKNQIRVSALCNKNFITVSLGSSVAEAIHQVRESAPRGHIFYLYVVDSTERLCGIVSIRNLLVGKDSDQIAQVYSPNVVFLAADLVVEEAYEIFSKSRFLSLPVVDSSGHMLGVLHAHELVEEHGKGVEHLFEERSRGDLFNLLGIKAEDAGKGPLPIAMGRMPWLLINMLGGTLSAIFIRYFGASLKDAVLFLAFVPILQIVSESIGMQTASMVITHLHNAKNHKGSTEFLWKELSVALLLGSFCATLICLGVFLLEGSKSLTFAVGFTIVVGTLGVCALGNTIPRLFHRFRVDPRVAAGPVIMALADCSTLLLYLLVALFITH